MALPYFSMASSTHLGLAIFGDVPGLWTWIGAGIVVACGIVAMRRKT
jgi:drug/metabolite transporter (DMT)-like permease